ncbi:ATP-binding protein [Microseira sp. BLCC-F43]|jgi:signal transduction histidine kinase|uniref:hybrid sensor histidine kinase/response regulator n=1 Tax=Microseira sp. BLCC-F43 TaxID=3153602 RepID=UPI0035B6D40A
MAQKKILVVEDEAIVAEAIAESLRKQGYEVVAIVTNGEEAIQKVAQNQPDLVLMDIVLEGDMDGIAAAEKIRTRCHIPTVFLTAYADEETLKRAKLTDPFGYIIKPFQQKDLYVTLEIALHRHELETKLRQALETAEQKADRQTKYVSLAAHELRNPLSAIVGSAKLLGLSSKLDEQTQVKCLDLMKSASQSMNQLIEDMLVIGRAESEQLKFNPAPLNLKEFCRHLVEQMQLGVEEKHRITFVCTSRKSVAVLDQRLLHHILSNLLSNGMKYSPKGGEVHLQLEYLENWEQRSTGVSPVGSLENSQFPIPDYPMVIFRVRDAGIGIPKQDQEKLFEAFYRCSNVGEIKGSGLGLAIVKKAVELHRGAIEFESEVGAGTTFTVILPSPTDK